MSQKRVNLGNLLQSLNDTAFYCRYFKNTEPPSNTRFNNELRTYQNLKNLDACYLEDWGASSMRALKTQTIMLDHHCRAGGHQIFRLARALRIQDWPEARRAVAKMRNRAGVGLLDYSFQPTLAFSASLKQMGVLLDQIIKNQEDGSDHKNATHKRCLYEESESVFSEMYGGFRTAMAF